MRCKKHPEDNSSSGGVCASCLRQRLVALIAVQAQAAQGTHFKEDERQSESHPPPLVLPRSVSPYISRRKFFSTPQIGPVRRVIVDDNRLHKKKLSRKFWLFSNWFRSDPSTTAATAIAQPQSWFSSIISRRRKIMTCYADESTSRGQRRSHRNIGQGMSPAMCSDEEDDKHCSAETSGCTTEEFKHTPMRTPGRKGGGRRSHVSRNVSDIVFCLSPLVRPSPNRIWNHKGGFPPEKGGSGEARVSAKPCNNIAASFCKSRSRKLADFGRGNRNH